jgi:hypothetical protein
MPMNQATPPGEIASSRKPKRPKGSKSVAGPKPVRTGPKRKLSAQLLAIKARATAADYASVEDACADPLALITEVGQLRDQNDKLKADCTTWREAFMRATKGHPQTKAPPPGRGAY